MALGLQAFVVTGLIFGALDALWLSFMSGRFYRPQLGALMRDQIAFPPALGFYVVYVTALTALAVLPAIRSGDSAAALRSGLLLGLAAYGTYNLTNAATLNGWPKLLTFVDWTWGTIASGVAAYLAVLAVRAMQSSGN